jgi:hypothetical protein
VDLQDDQEVQDYGNSLAVVQPSNQKVQVPQAASGQLATNNSSDYKTVDLIQALSQGNDASSVNANAGGAISYTYKVLPCANDQTTGACTTACRWWHKS